MAHLLILQNITKSYHLSGLPVSALKDIQLEIPDGDYIAIMGRSGSGKSTLLNILGCLDVPSSGEYYVNGQAVSKMDGNQLSLLRQKHFGFVFQHFFLVKHMNIQRNVALPMLYAGISRRQAEEEAEYLLKLVGLGDRLHHLPSQLSGGQQQRVAIARSLANKPETIIADEPTGALDTKTGEEIMFIFAELNRIGKRIIIVTHDDDVASHAKHTIHLSDGQIANR